MTAPRRHLHPGGGMPAVVTTPSTVPSYNSQGESTARTIDAEITETAIGKPTPIAYGLCKFSPNIIHAGLVGGTLQLIYEVSWGPIQQIVRVLSDGIEIYPTKRVGYTVVIRLGTSTQTKITEITDVQHVSAFPLKALVAVMVHLQAAGLAGIPQLEVECLGRQVWDPRLSRSVFSENPILHAFDALTHQEYGGGTLRAEMGATSWPAAATACDALVGGTADGLESADPFSLGGGTGVRDITSKRSGAYGYHLSQAAGAESARRRFRATVDTRPFAYQGWVRDTGRETTYGTDLPGLTLCTQVDLTSGYVARIDRRNGSADDTKSLQLLRVDGTVNTVLAASGVATVAASTWYRLSIFVDRQAITVQLWSAAGALLDQVVAVDTTYASGKAGVYSYDEAYFDDLLFAAVEPRYRATTVSIQRTSSVRLARDMLVACMGRLWWADGYYEVAIDAPGGSPAVTLADEATSGAYPIGDAGAHQSSLRCVIADDEIPNTVLATIMDTGTWTQSEVPPAQTAAVKAGSEQPRELRLAWLAVPSITQGYRMAATWLAKAQRPARWGLTLYGHALTLAPLDLVTLVSAVGSVNAVKIVNTVAPTGPGRFELELLDYSAADYVDDLPPTDAVTMPVTTDTTRGAVLQDDFTEGGTTSGTIGERGWTRTESGSGGTTSISYSTEADHPGTILASAAESYPDVSMAQTLALDSAAAKFAKDSKWSGRWIAKFGVQNGSANSHARVSIGPCMLDVTSTVLSYWSGSAWIDTGLRPGTTDWVDFSAWGDGAGTATYMIAMGTTVLTYSIAVSGSTADQTINCYVATYGTGTGTSLTADFALLRIPAVR